MDPHKPYQVPVVPGTEPAPSGLASAMPAPANRRRRWGWPLVVALVVAALAAGGFAVVRTTARNPSAPAGPTLAGAYKDCDQSGSLLDGGKTLVLDMIGTDRNSGSLSIQQVMCPLNALGVPASVAAQMQGTRALDGRQTKAWGSFEASWTYSPGGGLDVIITQVK